MNQKTKKKNNWKVIFKDKKWNKYERQPCEIWTRVLWYHRPVKYYNKGKKSEFYSRDDYEEEKSLNKKFNKKYS